jgi:hypothetical protein
VGAELFGSNGKKQNLSVDSVRRYLKPITIMIDALLFCHST